MHKKIAKKDLHSTLENGIIIKRDCTRYAMKREVAAEQAGFSVEYVRFQTGRKIFGTQPFSVQTEDWSACLT